MRFALCAACNVIQTFWPNLIFVFGGRVSTARDSLTHSPFRYCYWLDLSHVCECVLVLLCAWCRRAGEFIAQDYDMVRHTQLPIWIRFAIWLVCLCGRTFAAFTVGVCTFDEPNHIYGVASIRGLMTTGQSDSNTVSNFLFSNISEKTNALARGTGTVAAGGGAVTKLTTARRQRRIDTSNRIEFSATMRTFFARCDQQWRVTMQECVFYLSPVIRIDM